MAEENNELWFARKENGGIAFLTWQAKFATTLYVVLILLAVVLYSEISLIIFVVFFYTVVYAFLFILKSDVLKDRQPPES